MASSWVEVQVRWRGSVVAGWYKVAADPDDLDDMQRLGDGAIRKDRRWEERELAAYEIRVRDAESRRNLHTFTPRES